MSEKLLCPTCGLHFDDEFLDTLKPECGMWRAFNGTKLSDEDKKKVWDWWFSAPGNELAYKYNLHLQIVFAPFKTVIAGGEHGNEFATSVGEKRWKKMSELEQREYQRRYNKWIMNLQSGAGVWVHLAEEFARIDRVNQIGKLVSKLFTPKKKKKWRIVHEPTDVEKKRKRKQEAELRTHIRGAK